MTTVRLVQDRHEPDGDGDGEKDGPLSHVHDAATTTTTTPTPTAPAAASEPSMVGVASKPDEPAQPHGDKSRTLSTGAVAGIAVASALALIAVAGVCVLLFLRRRRRRGRQQQHAPARLGEKEVGKEEQQQQMAAVRDRSGVSRDGGAAGRGLAELSGEGLGVVGRSEMMAQDEARDGPPQELPGTDVVNELDSPVGEVARGGGDEETERDLSRLRVREALQRKKEMPY